MRRKDKEITTHAEIVAIIERCKVCRVAMCAQGMPYVVPVNFGYIDVDGQVAIYIHGAKSGKKNEILAENPNVCVEFDFDYGVIAEKDPCDYGYEFESVIGVGQAELLESVEEKTVALHRLMRQMTGRESDFTFPERAVAATAVYKIPLTELTGKRKLVQAGQ